MKITFIEPFDQELADGIEYYEYQLPVLGKAFYEEFLSCLERIEKFPLAWRKVGKKTRKSLLKSFPYFILYIFENDELYITAIGHQHRDPDFYFERIV